MGSRTEQAAWPTADRLLPQIAPRPVAADAASLSNHLESGPLKVNVLTWRSGVGRSSSGWKTRRPTQTVPLYGRRITLNSTQSPSAFHLTSSGDRRSALGPP